MLRRRRLVNRARDEIAEPFAGRAILCKGGKLFGEYLEDPVLADILRVKAIQPLAVEAAAQIQIVLTPSPARQRDLGDTRPRAAVWAAAHADGDRLLGKAVLIENGLNLADEIGQVALR